MKRTNMVLDEKLIKQGLKVTGIKTRRALVDYALRKLLCPESPKRILELKEKEREHGERYQRNPAKQRKLRDWEAEQVWVES